MNKFLKREAVLQQIIYQIFRLDDQLKAVSTKVTAPSGQSSACWQVMNAIEELPQTVAEIARLKNLARQSVQRTANLMVEDGVARFLINPKDQRAKLLSLTKKGRASLLAIQGERDRWLARAIPHLNTLDLDKIHSGLTDFESGLDAIEQEEHS